MSSTGLVVAIVILFILVTVAIVLSIVALVYSNDNSVPFSKVVVSDSNGADNKAVNVTNTTFIYYRVSANSTLTLSGRAGAIAIVRNDSTDAIVNILPANGSTFSRGADPSGGLNLNPNSTAIVVWKSDTSAVISPI